MKNVEVVIELQDGQVFVAYKPLNVRVRVRDRATGREQVYDPRDHITYRNNR